jgi:hypothetical protein
MTGLLAIASVRIPPRKAQPFLLLALHHSRFVTLHLQFVLGSAGLISTDVIQEFDRLHESRDRGDATVRVVASNETLNPRHNAYALIECLLKRFSGKTLSF